MMVCPGCGVAHGQPHGETDVEQLGNLGAASAGWLRQVGIHHLAELAEMGAVQAFLRMQHAGFKPGLNLLYALHGAISGKHWLEVKRNSQTELVLALEAAKEQVTS